MPLLLRQMELLLVSVAVAPLVILALLTMTMVRLIKIGLMNLILGMLVFRGI